MLGRTVVAVLLTAVAAIACSAPVPTPTNCWLALRGTYHLTGVQPDEAIELAPNTAGIMQERLHALGLANFAVAVDAGTITVDLPDVTDSAQEVRDLLTTRGLLSIVPVPQGQAIAAGDPAPAGVQPLAEPSDFMAITPTTDQVGQDSLEIALSAPAAAQLRNYTQGHVGQQMAIVLDGTVLSAPTVTAPLDSPFLLSGGFGEVPAERILAVFRSGAYPAAVVEDSFGAVGRPAGCPA
jgi:preprotein translocase subunit SecD